MQQQEGIGIFQEKETGAEKEYNEWIKKLFKESKK